MIKSMTAYAREELKLENMSMVWELRSVNHRYLEPYIRLPEDFRFMEADIREALKQNLHRGKLEVVLSINASDSGEANQAVNQENLQQLLSLTESVKQVFPDLRQISALEILKWPGILNAPSADVKEL
ncbi:MAG: YicC/YloC family endoribonuclease, partial [Gammaproteobacteria bacterium]|nr:YicC/YloC family endoribonuclease [Gammaproteobacteria bacterium]